MAKKWTKTEINYLNRYSGSKTLDELAQRFHTEPEELRVKLVELNLDSRDAAAGVVGPDPAADIFEEAFEALYAKKWSAAQTLFEKVLEDSVSLDLSDRARQFLELCRAKIADEDGSDDPYLHAVFLKNRGDLDAALEICQAKDHDKDERFVFLEASIHALASRTEDAVASLERAIEMNPENRVHAFHDRDFEALRESADHKQLFGLD
jgi:tetratricopeptide (TPR) repeat protein